jgi:hypothetical protein
MVGIDAVRDNDESFLGRACELLPIVAMRGAERDEAIGNGCGEANRHSIATALHSRDMERNHQRFCEA